MDKIQKDLVKYLEDYTGVNLGLKARSEINAALYAADRSRANRARTGGSTMTTSKEQAQAVVDDWCQEVEWFGDGTDALVRLIAAALDAADRAAYIRGQESMTVASENDRADARRKMGEEIEADFLDERWMTERDAEVANVCLAIVRKAAKGGLDE